MALKKNDRVNLKRYYTTTCEIGAIGALLVLILAFRMDIRQETDFEVVLTEQETVQMEEILQTEHIETPPPPPPPPIPVAVPDSEVLESEGLEWNAVLEIEDMIMNAPPPLVEDEEEEEPEPHIFMIVEQEPEPIGGMAGLQKRVVYPEMARRAGITGRVTIQFVVDEEGNVVEASVLAGLCSMCDEAALKAVRETKFTPGKQRGKPVKVRMNLPINFKLR